MKKRQLTIQAIRDLQIEGHFDAAKKGYLQLLKKEPSNVELLDSLGILYAQQENYTKAIEYLRKALQFQPDNPILNLHLANILKIQGLFKEAAEILERNITINPTYAPAFNNLGTIYYSLNQLDEAVNAYHSAIKIKQDYVDAYYNLGLALSKKMDWSEAISTYTKLLDLSPNHFAARFQLACAFMYSQKIPEAKKLFLEIEELSQHHLETEINLATCFLKEGNFKEAKIRYQRALDISPEDSQILFNLGVIAMQQGQIDSAIQYYQLAEKISPNNFSIHNNLGVAFLSKQHISYALHHFNEALRIQPQNSAIQHTIRILSDHQVLLTSPPDYIKSLFDSYADHYESHLLNALDYQIPQLFLKVLLRIHPAPARWRILDLGCGTGLCGVQLKQYASFMVGVDLSDKMLVQAADKAIYDELVCEDILTYLNNSELNFNLVVAGDTIVYLGNLQDIFKQVRAVLSDKGLFLFNAEISENNDFKMNQSGRFSHSKKYLETLAQQNRFKVVYYNEEVTRMQNNEPVFGHVIVLEAEPT